ILGAQPPPSTLFPYTTLFRSRHYRTTQLDSYTRSNLSADRLRRCLGEELWRALQAPAPRLSILEAGCGAGRFTEVLTRLPAAVEIGRASCRGRVEGSVGCVRG